MEAIHQLDQTKPRLYQWMCEGQDLLSNVIPALLEEGASRRQEVQQLRHQVQQLRHEVTEKENEIATLQGEIEQVKRERAEMADTAAGYLSEIGKITTAAVRWFQGTEERPRVSPGIHAMVRADKA
jgi:uncharacterized coiled-coil DUF342 family protein